VRAIEVTSLALCFASSRLSHRTACVNTSLSGTLFFLSRWCKSNVSAFRFPNARSDQAISLTEGNMAKKAKKAKKAKSAVKKTAKKTRKVAKKKK
jgi:hypothetical protein